MADNELVRVIRDDQARVNVTWQRQNGELPDPVFFDATDDQIRAWVTEAVRNGSVPGIPADPDADFTNFMIDRFTANDARPYNAFMIRPKTAYGASSCEHHWHAFSGVIHMVVPQGHIVQSCCKCSSIRTVHRGHAHE
jgi:hypothetical protein